MPVIALLWLTLSWIALVSTVAYGFTKGKPPEKLGCATIGIGGSLSWMAVSHNGHAFQLFEPLLATVDTMMLIVFLFLAMFANRWWPIWVFAFHLIACSSHLLKLLEPTMPGQVYARMESASAWPITIILAVCTRAQLQLIATRGARSSWSSYLPGAARLILLRLRMG